jgi:5'-3' exonuclease
MGIPGFFGQWLRRRNFRGVVTKRAPGQVSSLSIDMNSVFHETAQIVYAYGNGRNEVRARLIKSFSADQLAMEHYIAIGTRLMEIISAARPRETLVLVVDGVAVMAKIAQQRSRRFKAGLESKPGMFDSNAMTPGTEYMMKMDAYIQGWIEENRFKSPLPPRIIYSSWSSPGEGEHKIMSMFREGKIHTDETTGAHLVHGADTDMIMLSSLLKIPQVFWWRDSPNPREGSTYINIDNFRVVLHTNMGNKDYNVNDFVVMMFMIGNDFIPHAPSLDDYSVSIDTMIEIYANRNLTGEFPLTTSEGTINWNNFLLFLTDLSQKEPDLIDARREETFIQGFRALEFATEKTTFVSTTSTGSTSKFDFTKFRTAWYHYEFAPRNNPEIYEKIMGKPFSVGLDDIIGMSTQYLRGIAWNYAYYLGGTYGANVYWFYNYYKAPLFMDVVAVLRLNLAKQEPLQVSDQPWNLESQEIIDGWQYQEGTYLINPIHQLLAVLPKSSRRLLPREVVSLISSRSPIADYYPENFVIDMDGITKTHLGVAILPFVDPNRIIEAVMSHSRFQENIVKLYQPTLDIESIRDSNVDIMVGREREFRRNIRGRGRPQDVARHVVYEQREEFRGLGTGGRGRGRESRGDTGRYTGERESRGGRGRGNRGRDEGRRGRGDRGREGSRGDRGRGDRGRGNRGYRGRGNTNQGTSQMIPMPETVMVIREQT